MLKFGPTAVFSPAVEAAGNASTASASNTKDVSFSLFIRPDSPLVRWVSVGQRVIRRGASVSSPQLPLLLRTPQNVAVAAISIAQSAPRPDRRQPRASWPALRTPTRHSAGDPPSGVGCARTV